MTDIWPALRKEVEMLCDLVSDCTAWPTDEKTRERWPDFEELQSKLEAARAALNKRLEELVVGLLYEYALVWRQAYNPALFGDKTDWDSLDENGRIQAQRNAAGLMRHWADRIEKEASVRARALLNEEPQKNDID